MFYSVSEILIILLKSIFVGFGFLIPIFALIRTSNLKSLEFKDRFILTSVQMVRMAGILHLIINYLYVVQQMKAMEIIGDRNAYMFGLLLSPILYFVLSQLFLIKKLYMKKAALITLSVRLLILPSERIIMIVSSLNRDSLPGMWSINANMLKEGALNIIVFFFLTFAIMSFGRLRKRQ